MDLTTSLIILGLVVALDCLLVRSARAYFARHPLEETGVRPVKLFDKPSPMFTLVKIGGIRLATYLAGLRKIKDTPLSALLLLGAASVACGQVMRSVLEERGWLSLVFLFGGMALFAGGALKINNRRIMPVLQEAPTASIKIRPWQVFLLAAGPVLAITSAFLAGDDLRMNQPVAAVSCYLAGVAAVVVGAWQRGEGRSSDRSQAKQALLWAAGLTLFALPLRAYSLGSMPLVLTGDEGSFGMMAVKIIRGEIDNIFATGALTSYSIVSFSILTLPIRILGQTTEALRIISALVGALTVGALYWLGRRMFNHATALLAAFFLAVLHYHIHFSRLGINNIWDGLFYVVFLGCLWAGLREEKRAYFIAAGLALGFSQLFYASSRSLILLVPVYLFGLAVRDWPRLRRALPNLGLMALIALVVFMPLGYYYLKHPLNYLAPMAWVNLTPAWFAQSTQNLNTSVFGVMLNQFKLSMQAFTDTNLHMWYDTRSPMLLAIPSVLFLLGIVLILARRRWRQAWLLGCWLGVFVLIGALSQDTPAAQRYVAAAPAAALLVGYAIHTSADLLKQLWPKWSRVWLALTISLMIIIGWREFQHYFIEYIPRSTFDGHTLTANYLAGYLKDKPAGTEVCFFGQPNMNYNSINALPYLSPHIQGRDCEYPWTEKRPAPVGDAVFVFLPHKEAFVDVIQAQFPGGSLIEVPAENHTVLIWIYDTTQ
jgi:hypothetical protein